MAPAHTLILLITLAFAPLAALGQGADGASVPIQNLPEFSTIQLCVPFNVYITPSTQDTPAYGLQVESERDVSDAIRWTVSNGTLQLESGAFISEQPIKVALYLPPDAFTALDNLGQLSTIYVAQGFAPSNFTLRQGAGGGGVYLFGMDAASLSISAQGSMGDIVALGSYGDVQVRTQGISNLYVAGVQKSVTVQLAGITNLYLEAASPDVSITGRADGISSVVFTQGQCSVQSAFLLSSPCQQNPAISAARAIPSPSWTEGLTARGAFSCALGASYLTPVLQYPLVQPLPPAFVYSPPVTPPTSPEPVPPTPPPSPSSPPPQPVPQAPAGTRTAASATPGSRASAAASATGQPPSAAQAGGQPPAPAPTPPVATPTPAGASTQAAAPESPPTPPAPAPESEGPYAFTVPGPPGTQQSQAGSVTPAGSQAQSAASGQRQASASAVAGPGQASTGTQVDQQQPVVAGTQG